MRKESRNRSVAFAALRVASTLELLSLTVILANRFSTHLPAITSTGGPIHGVLYISTIALALTLPLPRSSKWLAVIPGVGGLLALWWSRRIAARATLPPQAEHDVDGSSDDAALFADEGTASLPAPPPAGRGSFP